MTPPPPPLPSVSSNSGNGYDGGNNSPVNVMHPSSMGYQSNGSAGSTISSKGMNMGNAGHAVRSHSNSVLPLKDASSTSNYNVDVFGRKKSWSDQVADNQMLIKPATGMANYSLATAMGYRQQQSNNNSAANDVKFVHSTMEILQDQIKREEAPKKKRTRTTTEQLKILQRAFTTDPMPNSNARVTLSKRLGMSARAVQVWFQNRRAKEKLDAKRVEMGLPTSSAFVRSQSNSGEDDNNEYEEDDEDLDGNAYDSSDDIEPQIRHNTHLHSLPPPPLSSSALPHHRPVPAYAANNHNNGNAAINNDLLNSLKANGMLSRLAFNGKNNHVPTALRNNINGALHNHSHTGSNSNAPSSHNYFPTASPFPNAPSPGPYLIDSMNDPSVDQLYQDLGVSGGLISPPLMPYNHNGHNNNNNINTHRPVPTSDVNGVANTFAMFAFGEPFFASGGDGTGSAVDRAPSVSPVGFMMLNNGGLHGANNNIGINNNNSAGHSLNNITGSRAYSLPVASPFDLLPASTYIDNARVLNRSHSPVNAENANSPVNNSGAINASDFSAAYRLPTCGNVCLSSVILSSSSSSNNNDSSTFSSPTSALKGSTDCNNNAVRRSFSLPEAHSNLTAQQLSHLESFGVQIYPSPLMSIHEEENGNPLPFESITTFGTQTQSIPKSRRMSEGALVAASIDANNLMAFSEYLDAPLISNNNADISR